MRHGKAIETAGACLALFGFYGFVIMSAQASPALVAEQVIEIPVTVPPTTTTPPTVPEQRTAPTVAPDEVGLPPEEATEQQQLEAQAHEVPFEPIQKARDAAGNPLEGLWDWGASGRVTTAWFGPVPGMVSKILLSPERRAQINLYAREDVPLDRWPMALARALGHAADAVCLDGAKRTQWAQARGFDAQIWWQTEDRPERSSGSGDWAEAVTAVALKQPSRSEVAGALTDEQRELVRQWLAACPS